MTEKRPMGLEMPERAPPTAPVDAVVELCAFRVGDEEYVIDLKRLREILKPLPIVPVPRAPDFIEGVMNLRGEVIPVLDVRKRLGVALRGGARSKVLVVQVAGRPLGLIVDAVCEVMRIPRSSIGPPPPLLAGRGQRLFLGVCGVREARAAKSGSGRVTPQRLRLLLNVKALFEASAQMQAVASRGATADTNQP